MIFFIEVENHYHADVSIIIHRLDLSTGNHSIKTILQENMSKAVNSLCLTIMKEQPTQLIFDADNRGILVKEAVRQSIRQLENGTIQH